MVTKKIDTRSLSLELSWPALQLDVRVNVELRTHHGCPFPEDGIDREVATAVSETLQVHADLFRFEVVSRLPKSVRAREKALNLVDGTLNGVTFSTRWQAHNCDQLDLFERAGKVGANLISAGLLVSPTEDQPFVDPNELLFLEAELFGLSRDDLSATDE